MLGRRGSIALFFFFQAEDGIRDLVRSRGLGDVYKRQMTITAAVAAVDFQTLISRREIQKIVTRMIIAHRACLLYTSDAADERSSVDLGGRRIIKKKKQDMTRDDSAVRDCERRHRIALDDRATHSSERMSIAKV